MKAPWLHYLAELVGTAALVGIGLSIVILDFAPGGPVAALLPDAGVRRAITGFLFGSTGALIAVSPVGKVSGAHINPAVTFAFALMGKLRRRHAYGYVAAQLTGALLGALPLLVWGGLGASVQFGASLPGPGVGPATALFGELVTTLALVVGLFSFLVHDRVRRFTPLLFPFLYAVMVWLEAPISGTSTNPARSLGPAAISGDWRAWWVYFLGPGLGAAIGVLLFRFSPLRRFEIEVAKLYHFEHDPHGIFRWDRGSRGGSHRGGGGGRQRHPPGAPPVTPA